MHTGESIRLKPWLPLIIGVVAITATLLYWRHWIHKPRGLEKAQSLAQVAKRSCTTHPAHCPISIRSSMRAMQSPPLSAESSA